MGEGEDLRDGVCDDLRGEEEVDDIRFASCPTPNSATVMSMES